MDNETKPVADDRPPFSVVRRTVIMTMVLSVLTLATLLEKWQPYQDWGTPMMYGFTLGVCISIIYAGYRMTRSD